MDTVTISSDRRLSLHDFRSKIGRRLRTILANDPDRLIVMRGNSHVFIRYAQNEDGTTDFGRVWLDYYSVPLVKQILTIVGDDPTYVIDNEFNTILRGDEFVARIRSDPGWEWKV